MVFAFNEQKNPNIGNKTKNIRSKTLRIVFIKLTKKKIKKDSQAIDNEKQNKYSIHLALIIVKFRILGRIEVI